MLVHGGNFGDGVLDFSVNTNPCVTEELMTSLMKEQARSALTYPEIDGDQLLHVIAKSIGVDPTRLVLGNGATDCLYRAMQVLKPSTAVVIEPTFSEYRQAMKHVGTNVASLTYNLHEPSGRVESSLLNKVKKLKADLVVVCNPNNPSSHCYSLNFINELVAIQKAHKGYVMVDESFRFFEDMNSCYSKEAWNLIVLTSLTKYYGIPGLRIGYMTGNFTLIADMKHLQMPWNLNGPVIHITKALIENSALKEATSHWYQAEKSYMMGQLHELEGLEVLPSRANYFLCHLEKFKGSEMNDWLLMQSEPMAIRECASFEGLSDSYIRIGMKSHQDNSKLMEKLKEYWGKHSE